MSNFFSVRNSQRMVPAYIDIQYDLDSSPRNFDFEKLRKGFAEFGYPPELIEAILSTYPKVADSDEQEAIVDHSKPKTEAASQTA
ncbi:hypothetical protein QN224_13700 [Sinorhizobium sp. 8-89]|uniref:hypothetical protein n=1 Tax=Sinorhizobium sp. 7-81 TaxID=3049087 RepID=UPI0024C21A6A|nr:hypothetical protein [Sinorhizobium sp. 7-81]MDK1386460.1 hypothetical protein [Sinorhizobium sp. 7-81]